jgi:hypothetical protein
MPLQPGHIRWSVVYVNQTTITLDGEVFYKQANLGAAVRQALWTRGVRE